MVKSIDALSYYQATANSSVSCESLKGEVSADVCIIGAGYTGLSAALELATAGYKVVVLEAEHVGYGASGRNGGQVCTGFSSGQQKIENQLGKADARKCFALAEESKTLLKQRRVGDTVVIRTVADVALAFVATRTQFLAKEDVADAVFL